MKKIKSVRLSQQYHAVLKGNIHLTQRTRELAASNRQLKSEIVQHRTTQRALKLSEHRHEFLLTQALEMQTQLRHLSYQILSAQEKERKRISRELHDVIAQLLAGINIKLATLKHEAAVSRKGLDKKIASTQHLIEKSVNIVHRFARELRPPLLDDLGLIPALNSYMKGFTKRTGVRIRFTAFAEVEQLDGAKRTVLYRVAQEALTNVAQHAQASLVKVSIQKLPNVICMAISDNGKAFAVERVLFSKKFNRLGVLGMRERVEMVGGNFSIESKFGKGTLVQARIPFKLGARL
jgi:signal transduction histidine kinase